MSDDLNINTEEIFTQLNISSNRVSNISLSEDRSNTALNYLNESS
jgi:hypothetical protein